MGPLSKLLHNHVWNRADYLLPHSVELPWVFEAGEDCENYFATEDEACKAQRMWRHNHGLDAMTGEPLEGRILNITALIRTLARVGAAEDNELNALMDQAIELAQPIRDYEGAARAAGFDLKILGQVERVCRDPHKDGSYPTLNPRCWAYACEDHNITPHERTPTEFWIVTDDLGRDLDAKGEKVRFFGTTMTVWARCDAD